MLIRSQNREILINFNNSPAIGIMEAEGDVRITCSDTDETFDIGHYSTKEKAIKVLDMIQEAYKNNGKYRTLLTGFTSAAITKDSDSIDVETIGVVEKALRESYVFQMPEDSEVEE